VVFETEEGAVVTYYDPRRFGFMDLIPTDRVDQHPWFATMGPEPLGDGFDAKTLVAAFANRKQGPKTLLLDQKTVAGLGNIYVCEALHRAHISPFKPAGMIAGKRLGPLTTAIKEVLAEAVEVGGSTLKDFAAADGALGYFQHRFRVYDREGQPCPTPGLQGRDRPRGPGGPLDLLLPGLPGVIDPEDHHAVARDRPLVLGAVA
jgi:formamidopyrimidine-DNA glycosylase